MEHRRTQSLPALVSTSKEASPDKVPPGIILCPPGAAGYAGKELIDLTSPIPIAHYPTDVIAYFEAVGRSIYTKELDQPASPQHNGFALRMYLKRVAPPLPGLGYTPDIPTAIMGRRVLQKIQQEKPKNVGLFLSAEPYSSTAVSKHPIYPWLEDARTSDIHYEALGRYPDESPGSDFILLSNVRLPVPPTLQPPQGNAYYLAAIGALYGWGHPLMVTVRREWYSDKNIFDLITWEMSLFGGEMTKKPVLPEEPSLEIDQLLRERRKERGE